MPLEIGQQLRANMLNIDLTVKKKLGEGTQGIVYLVEGQGFQAVKWYNYEQSTDEQKSNIQYLVENGPPKGIAGSRFIWPLDLVTIPNSKQFGYLMKLIDTKKFAQLGEVWAHIKPAPSFSVLCEISYQLADSYRTLHLSGHCYRDISDGNLMFDPKSGECLICDNDNVGVKGESKCQVWGTMEYMVPGIIKGDTQPSIETDLHSLAIFLFNLWVWHHPFHGKIESNIRIWDIPAKKRVYGLPVFIFDPLDSRNRLPNDPDYSTARTRWGYCPTSLQKLFTNAFTVGLKEPARCVTEGEWQNLFLQLKDGVIICPNCRAENLWEPDLTTLNCWHCAKQIPLPPKLIFTHSSGKHYLLLTRNAQILERHINPTELAEKDATNVIGQVVQNPTNSKIWGIRNLTNKPWTTTLPDNTIVEISPQKALPINEGSKLNISGTIAEIVA